MTKAASLCAPADGRAKTGPLRAEASIPFPAVDAYFDMIVQSLSAHNMVLSPDGEAYAASSSFGAARLCRGKGVLDLSVEAPDPIAFNRMKHDLTSLIDFVARPENLTIRWTGDAPGAMPPADLRILTVRTVRDLTPCMRRITFEGEDLARYAVADQIHCRLLFQDRDAVAPQWPCLDDNGRIVWPETGKLATRIFTIRHVDPAAGTIVIDFVVHGGMGPGASWARAAEPGDIVGILGPAAHGAKPADWYLLAGDETALPGIARILEELPRSARGVVFLEVANREEEQVIDVPPGIRLTWLHRNGAAPGTTTLLADAVRGVALPANHDGVFVWVGAEHAAFRAIHSVLRKDAGLASSRLVAFSYWRRGMSEEEIAEAGAAAVSA